jgi:hypothetical protein
MKFLRINRYDDRPWLASAIDSAGEREIVIRIGRWVFTLRYRKARP